MNIWSERHGIAAKCSLASTISNSAHALPVRAEREHFQMLCTIQRPYRKEREGRHAHPSRKRACSAKWEYSSEDFLSRSRISPSCSLPSLLVSA